MKNLIQRFVREEEGQDLAEYGLLVALIAFIVLLGVQTFGNNLLAFFQRLANTVSTLAGGTAA
jgi:pilus assembly protein Flp/PilA